MRKALFRHQATTHQTSAVQGDLLMTPKPSYMMITGVLFVWILGVSIYLTSANYQRKATVTGWLEPTDGVHKLYANARKGLITEVYVTEGEHVAKGAPLLTINYGIQQANGHNLEAQLKDELLAKQKRTLASLARIETLQKDTYHALSQQLQRSQTDVISLTHISELSHQQWQLTNNRFLIQRELYDQGYISQSDFSSFHLQRLTSEQQWHMATRDIKQGEAEVAQLQHDISALPQQHQEERDQLKNRLSDIQQQLLTLEREHFQVLYAQEKGIISNLQAKRGHAVDSQRPLLSVLPDNSTINARLLVPVSAAGFIIEGQQVDIRYDAFPYQKFGFGQGNIVSISKTILLPGEWGDAPISVNEPAYLVTANITNNAILAYGKPIPLKTGMTFTADVVLSQRTLLEWFLEPLLSVTRRGQ